jgi:hypothetical protein
MEEVRPAILLAPVKAGNTGLQGTNISGEAGALLADAGGRIVDEARCPTAGFLGSRVPKQSGNGCLP